MHISVLHTFFSSIMYITVHVCMINQTNNKIPCHFIVAGKYIDWLHSKLREIYALFVSIQRDPSQNESSSKLPKFCEPLRLYQWKRWIFCRVIRTGEIALTLNDQNDFLRMVIILYTIHRTKMIAIT